MPLPLLPLPPAPPLLEEGRLMLDPPPPREMKLEAVEEASGDGERRDGYGEDGDALPRPPCGCCAEAALLVSTSMELSESSSSPPTPRPLLVEPTRPAVTCLWSLAWVARTGHLCAMAVL